MLLFTNVGLPSTSFSVYQHYIVGLPDVGDIGGSAVLSARTFTTLAVLFVVDRYYELLDVRRGAFLATLATAGGFAVYSCASTLPLLLVGAVLTGAGYGLGGYVAVTVLTNRWYRDGIGAAIGIATIGSGVAGIVMPVVVVQIVEAASLQMAFAVTAAIVGVAALAVFSLVRNRPSDLGLSPYEEADGRQRSKARSSKRSGEPLGLDRAARAFGLLACGLCGAFAVGSCAYLSVLFTTNGFDAQTAALLISACAVSLTVAKFAVGEAFDRIGTPVGSGMAFASAFAGLVLCCLAPTGSIAVAVCGAVLLGCGMSLGSVGISVWSLEFADASNIARSVKNAQIAFAAGGFVSNTFPGLLKELTGSYVPTYEVFLVLAVATAVIVLGLYRRYRA